MAGSPPCVTLGTPEIPVHVTEICVTTFTKHIIIAIVGHLILCYPCIRLAACPGCSSGHMVAGIGSIPPRTLIQISCQTCNCRHFISPNKGVLSVDHHHRETSPAQTLPFSRPKRRVAGNNCRQTERSL